MVFYRFLSVYLPCRPWTEAGIEARVGIQETTKVKIRILLLSVGGLPVLRRMQDPAI